MDVYQRDWNEYVEHNRLWLEQQVAIAADADVTVTQELAYGMPGQKICDRAHSWEADLVVVGSHGRTGLSELLLGSVSNYVMHRAPCSVVILHPGRTSVMGSRHSDSTAQTPRRILVPIDRSDAAIQAIQDATALAKVFGAEIRLVHVLIDGEPGSPNLPIFDSSYYIANSVLTEQYHHDWNKFVNDWWIYLRSQATDVTAEGVAVSYDVMQGEAGAHICQAAKDWDADLIVMGSRGLSGVKQLLLGSTSQYVAHRAPCSVWVTHGKRSDATESTASQQAREPASVA